MCAPSSGLAFCGLGSVGTNSMVVVQDKTEGSLAWDPESIISCLYTGSPPIKIVFQGSIME